MNTKIQQSHPADPGRLPTIADGCGIGLKYTLLIAGKRHAAAVHYSPSERPLFSARADYQESELIAWNRP